MKIVISADIEGVSGVANTRQIGYPNEILSDPQSNPDYLQARRLLTGDINAAIEGAISAGGDEFIVHDSHGSDYINVIYEDLHPKAEIIQGKPVCFFENEDLESEYDGAFLIGMHAKAMDTAILSHVYSPEIIREVRINDCAVGESEITIGLAAHYGCPTVLITGDNIVCDEVKRWMGDGIETAVVKTSLSRYAVKNKSLETSRQIIKSAAYRAVKSINDAKCKKFTFPLELEVVFQDQEMAKYVSWIPGVIYDNNYTVSCQTEDFLSLYKYFIIMARIAG